MRILVFGSRDWPDWKLIYGVLNSVMQEFDLNCEPDEYGNTLPDPNKVTIVHGACKAGADSMADDWCNGHALLVPERHPAEWEKYGRRKAGAIRNREMVKSGIDLALGFIYDNSQGSSMMLDMVQKAGIPYREYRMSSGGVIPLEVRRQDGLF